MAKSAAKILEEKNIPYMIAYGTLLGAVRHKGFIEWDDDFDLNLFEDSYQEAINYLREELPDDLFVEDEKTEPKFFHAWARLKDLKTEVFNAAFAQDNFYRHKGINLDLYKLKKISANKLSAYIEEENLNYLNRRLKKNLITTEEYESRIKNFQIDPQNFIKEDGDKLIYAVINPYKCKRHYIEDILPLKKYKFEDTEFYGPNNADKILTEIYGDYMKLPPVEERKGHYSKIIFK